MGELLIRRHVLVHIEASAREGHAQKWELLIFMLQKLYAMAAGRVREDNPDSLVNQEVLLPGHLWEMILTLTLTLTLILTLPLTLTRCCCPATCGR